MTDTCPRSLRVRGLVIRPELGMIFLMKLFLSSLAKPNRASALTLHFSRARTKVEKINRNSSESKKEKSQGGERL